MTLDFIRTIDIGHDTAADSILLSHGYEYQGEQLADQVVPNVWDVLIGRSTTPRLVVLQKDYHTKELRVLLGSPGEGRIQWIDPCHVPHHRVYRLPEATPPPWWGAWSSSNVHYHPRPLPWSVGLLLPGAWVAEQSDRHEDWIARGIATRPGEFHRRRDAPLRPPSRRTVWDNYNDGKPPHRPSGPPPGKRIQAAATPPTGLTLTLNPGDKTETWETWDQFVDRRLSEARRPRRLNPGERIHKP